MGKALGFLLAMVAGVVVVGWLFIHLIGPVLFYLIVGAIVAAGAVYLYSKARQSLAPGTRTQRRIEAAQKTYRMRNR